VYSGFADAPSVVYGMVHSGRDAPVDGIEEIVAPTIAITPMVAAVDPSFKFVDLATAHQKALSDMTPHRHFGLQHIQALGSNYKAACDFRALLVIQSEIDSSLPDGPLILESVSEPRYDYPLVVSITMRENQTVVIEIRYEEAVISTEAARCILDRLEDVSKQLEDFGVQQTVEFLQNPSQTHLERIITSTSATSAMEMHVQDIFYASAHKAPQNPAIFDQELGVSLTYSEVERLSKLLAQDILQRGVKPGSVIPICIGNSAYAVLGILAIHQAGCAYVPIDPEHPMKRQDFIIGQVNAKILLCTSHACARYAHFAGQIINVDEVVPVSSEQALVSADRAVDECNIVGSGALGSKMSEDGKFQVKSSNGSMGKPTDTAFVLFTSGKKAKSRRPT
jgi:non-ribosomal peptide synthetase component F